MSTRLKFEIASDVLVMPLLEGNDIGIGMVIDASAIACVVCSRSSRAAWHLRQPLRSRANKQEEVRCKLALG